MPLDGNDQSWVARALCAEYEPDALFVQGASQRQIRLRCMECEVRLECLADALQSSANYGVWGGLTERERRALLKHYPHVTDWAEWITTSDDPLACEIRAPKVPRILARVRA
ncbi:WhiB family transcriptional regulator [Schaalia suimastitidis]|uniref:WhiB family transcriptional regulator n=1 Tax=Schaalia suimastitidis TaxID=121163 RepID=UPI00040D3EB5|nr:WhiB family transcriptional regulator [Schaalia suimastitidis]